LDVRYDIRAYRRNHVDTTDRRVELNPYSRLLHRSLISAHIRDRGR
jgi:hypothetical protein